MKRIIVLLILCLTAYHSNVLANEKNYWYYSLKFGNKLIAYSIDESNTNNNTIVNLDIYSGDLKKIDQKKIVVDDLKCKYITLYHLQHDWQGRPLFIEFILQDKIFSGQRIFFRLDANLNIQAKYKLTEEDTPTRLDEAYFEKEQFTHYPTRQGRDAFAYSDDLDDRTVNGGSVYYYCTEYSYDMHYTSNNIYNSNKEVDSKLVYMEAMGNSGYKKKWTINTKEEKIIAFRVFVFGKRIVLYTSYFVAENPKNNHETEQCIRCIDIETGEVLYKAILEKKEGLELMISNVYFDSASSSTYYCGNYITTALMSKWDKTPAPLSLFFIGNINPSGTAQTKVVNLEYSIPLSFDDRVAKIPFLLVKQFVRQKDGLFLIGAQLDFLCDEKYYKNSLGALGEDYMRGYINTHFYVLRFDEKLSIQFNSSFPLEYNKNPRIFGGLGFTPRSIMLNPKKGNDLFDAVWDNESQTLAMVQWAIEKNEYNCTLFALRIEPGSQAKPKKITSLKAGNSNNLFFFGKMYDLNHYITSADPGIPNNKYISVQLN